MHIPLLQNSSITRALTNALENPFDCHISVGSWAQDLPPLREIRYPQTILCLWTEVHCWRSLSLHKYKLEQEPKLSPREGNHYTGEVFSLFCSIKAEQVWEVILLLKISMPEVLCKINVQVQILSSRGQKLHCTFNTWAEWFWFLSRYRRHSGTHSNIHTENCISMIIELLFYYSCSLNSSYQFI